MSRVRDVLSELVRGGRIRGSSLKACTAEEVGSIEKHFGCVLPASYRDFLSMAGHGAGRLFRGTDIFYPRVLGLQRDAIDLFREHGKVDLLPADAKVFCMHQGYEVNFFLPGLDDPAVFQFVEGAEVVSRAWESFSDYLVTSIESHLKQWVDLD